MDEEFVVVSDTNLITDNFALDLARYYKAYVETGFSGSLRHGKTVDLARPHRLKASLYLDAYPQLYKNLHKNLVNGFPQESLVVAQSKYVSPGNELVKRQLSAAIKRIDDQLLEVFKSALVRGVKKVAVTAGGAAQNKLQLSLAELRESVIRDIIVPLFAPNKGEIHPEERETQQEVTEVIYAALLSACDQAFSDFITSGDEATLSGRVHAIIDADLLRAMLREYLDEQVERDAYANLYQLHRHRNVLPDVRMYLYFCEVTIDDFTFPLFYTPVDTSHAYPAITTVFSDQIVINDKAVDYALRRYSQILSFEQSWDDSFDASFIVTNANQKDLLAWMQGVIEAITEAFDLDNEIKLDNPSLQTAKNFNITLTSRLQFALESSRNEAVAGDYKEILAEGSKVADDFHALVSSHVVSEPVRYTEEVAKEWKDLPTADKLITENVLPLNDEQKQALIAFKKPESSMVVADGAGGTGKTHFASAVIIDALMSNSNALVVADTQATRDAYAVQIHQALATVREGMVFHSPVLLLGDRHHDQISDIETQFIARLRKYSQKFASLQSELKTAKGRKRKELEDTIATLFQSAENVNLHEVEQIIRSESKFADTDWVLDEPIEEIGPELQQLHTAAHYIKTSDANYLLPYVESKQEKAISEFISIIREYERINKTVSERLPEFIVRFRTLLNDQKNDLQSSLSYIHSNARQFSKLLSTDPITAPFEIAENSTFKQAQTKQKLFVQLLNVAKGATRYLPAEKTRSKDVINELLDYQVAPEEAAISINNYVEQVESLKSKIFGFSGRTLVVENLTRQLRKAIPQFSVSEPEKKLDELEQMVRLLEYVIEQLAQKGLDLSNWKQVLHVLKADGSRIDELSSMLSAFSNPARYEFLKEHRIYEADNLLANISLLEQAAELNKVYKEHQNLSKLFGIKTIGQVLAQPQAYTSRFNKLSGDLDDVKKLEESKKIIKQFMQAYPALSKRLGVQYSNGILNVLDDSFMKSTIDEVKEYLNFKKKEQDVRLYFKELTADNYARAMGDLRQMTATQLSYSLDGRLMKIVEQSAEAFTSLKQALNDEKRLTIGQVKTLQSIFPCVVVDVRSYSRYLPLKKDLFDVLVLDDAHRLSVADILPAVFRVKKTLVLGDSKIASLIPTQQLEGLKGLLQHRVEVALADSVSDKPVDVRNLYLKRLRSCFDVEHTALAFAQRTANFIATFTHYFQSPPELVGNLNAGVYNQSLRCLKARALPLHDTVKIDELDSAAAIESATLRTNPQEVKRIAALLIELKNEDYNGTIGIVTPYHEQAVLIQKELDESVINEWYERRNLRVMTLEMAQNEARDYMIYSLVATNEHDDLNTVAMSQARAKKDGNTLLIGKTNATIHFVLSKPVQTFTGAWGEVLMYYARLLDNAKVKSNIPSTDIMLGAENLLPQYFYTTKFYKRNSDRVRLISQFSLGDLMQPLIAGYQHPGHKVDFLVTVGDERIIITYDEFNERFKQHSAKGAAYLSPEELYAQKVLESYGYRFIRLNKFNLNVRPVEMLDRLLDDAVKHSSWARDNGFIIVEK